MPENSHFYGRKYKTIRILKLSGIYLHFFKIATQYLVITGTAIGRTTRHFVPPLSGVIIIKWTQIKELNSRNFFNSFSVVVLITTAVIPSPTTI